MRTEGFEMFTTVAQIDDVPEGALFGVDVNDHEIVLVNVEGTIYALERRCGHAGAPLSEGKLIGTTLICPMHFAEFDVTTGEKLKDPVEDSPAMQELAGLMDQLSEGARIALGRTMELSGKIRTYNLKIYLVQIDGTDIQIDV
jgi:nitrite reductase/ring-hydroxylating ferredoxin subunit